MLLRSIKHIVGSVLILVSTGTLATSSAQKSYPSPYNISIDRQLIRTPIITYRKMAHALGEMVDSTVNFRNLTLGNWSVKYYNRLDDALVDQQVRNLSLNPLDSLKLPLSWPLSGHGTATWAERSYVKDSSVALYGRKFLVPFDYLDKSVYIRLGGGSCSLRLFINGQFAGLTTDSRMDAEFNISQYITRGINEIEVMVQGWDPSGMLECQTGWRLAGINREIALIVQPKIRIFDFLNTTTLDPTYQNGLLTAAILLKTELLNSNTVTVHYDLFDPQGNLVNQEFRDVTVGMRTVDTVRFLSSIQNVKKWNAEEPNLYTILYRIKREGRWSEYACSKVGFRVIQTKGGKLLLNGEPLIIKGVNLAEHNHLTGNTIDKEQVRREIMRMKLSGLNAIRSDGYPLPHYVYDLADELGMYVCEVANLNTQALDTRPKAAQSLTNNPSWCEPILDRLGSIYHRGKNHPSIILWAMGSESGNGYNMYRGYLMLKELDKSRPVQYDDADGQWNTDILCPLYPTANELSRAQSDPRPIIPSKVKFDNRYWTSPKFQGAFLERWLSPSIENPKARFARQANNGRTVKLANGIMEPDGFENQLIFDNLRIETLNETIGLFSIENRLQFTTVTSLDYTLRVREKVISRGKVELKVAPGQTAQFSLPKGINLKKRGSSISFSFGKLYYYYYDKN